MNQSLDSYNDQFGIEGIAHVVAGEWNPWIDRAKTFADIGDDEWTQMLCVETCNVRDEAIVLDAGQSHIMTVSVAVSDPVA